MIGEVIVGMIMGLFVVIWNYLVLFVGYYVGKQLGLVKFFVVLAYLVGFISFLIYTGVVSMIVVSDYPQLSVDWLQFGMYFVGGWAFVDSLKRISPKIKTVEG